MISPTKAILKKLAAVLGVSVGLSLLWLLLGGSAYAEGIPGGSLAACSTPGDRGGWALRTFTSYGGNNDQANVPTRPRNLTLGEPCVTDTDDWAVPLRMAEVIPSSATLEEMWNPPVSLAPYCEQRDFLGTPTLATIGPLLVECDGSTKIYHYSAHDLRGIVDASVTAVVVGTSSSSPGRVELTMVTTGWTGPTTTSAGAYFSARLYCVSTDGLVWDYVSDEFYNASQNGTTTGNLICPVTSGKTMMPYSVIARSSYDDTLHQKGGVIWRADGSEVVGSVGTILGYQAAYARIGAAADPDPGDVTVGYFLCSDTRTGETFEVGYDTTIQSVEWTAEGLNQWGVPLEVGELLQWTRTDNMLLGPTLETCPYLTSVVLTVCTWFITDLDGDACTTTQWDLATWLRHPVYDEPDPYGTICEGVQNGGYDGPCGPVLYPDAYDYSTYADACPDPPAPAWLDFSWLPEFVAYHATCLFLPQGGGDSQGKMRAAVEGSSIGEIGQLFDEAAAAFTFSGSCGVILDASATPMNFVLNTCDLEGMSAIKPYLSAGMWILFGLWAINWVANTLIGIVNKKTLSPITDGDDK